MVDKSILNEADLSLISAATAKAEAETSGEIVTIVTHQSERYLAETLGIAIVVSFITGAIVNRCYPSFDYNSLTLIQIGVIAALVMVLEISGIIVRFIPRPVRKASVSSLARQQFLSWGLHRTSHRATILILISLREKCAELISDVGIDAKVAPGTWDHIAQKLSEDMAAIPPGAAIGEAIAGCAHHLKTHFPRGAGDTNEFSDQIISI